MSSVFENVLVLIGSNIFIISSRLDICCVELISDDVREAEDNKTGFSIVEVDIFDQLFLKKTQFPCP